MRPANERWRYNVKSSLIAWVQFKMIPVKVINTSSKDLEELVNGCFLLHSVKYVSKT